MREYSASLLRCDFRDGPAHHFTIKKASIRLCVICEASIVLKPYDVVM